MVYFRGAGKRLLPSQVAFILLVAVLLHSARIRNSSARGGPEAGRLAAFAELPLLFEANHGQTDSRFNYLCRLGEITAFFKSGEIVLRPDGNSRRSGKAPLLRMKLEGADNNSKPEGLEPQPAKSHYFIGNDPSGWLTEIPHYMMVRYTNVYPGIDLVVRGNPQNLEYDFIVRPGANPNRIRWKIAGAERVALDASGDLRIAIVGQEIVQRAPDIYQRISERAVEVRGGFYLRDDQVGFHVESYDYAQPLIIDPVIVYSTYLGGNGREDSSGIAVDGSKNVYVTGTTNSLSLQPASPNSVLVSTDVFVAKLNPSGSSLVYVAYIGGDQADVAAGIAVDDLGSAYVAGRANSSNFPVTPGAFQTRFGGTADAFVARLNPSGSALEYCTLLGGSTGIGYDSAEDIAVDSLGEACVVGSTESDNFPTRNPFQAGRNFSRDAFVTKLNAAGSGLIFSTYLGGGPSPGEAAYAVAVDSAGSVYVTGQTAAVDFPTTAGALQPAFRGVCVKDGDPVPCADAFVAKFSPLGILIYSTYLGGAGEEKGTGIAVDGQGNSYVAGSTASTNFPLVTPIQAVNAGTTDVFISKVNPSGSALIYSTLLGGGNTEDNVRVAIDSKTNAYLVGVTRSQGFPLSDPVQSAFGGIREIFLSKVDRSGTTLGYSTFLGGSGNERFPRVAVDFVPNVYVTGATTSADIPLVNPLQAKNRGGTGDLFVYKISEIEQPACALGCSANVTPAVRTGLPATFTASSAPSHCTDSVEYDWDFGDSSVHQPGQSVSHVYAVAGTYNWKLTVRSGEVSCTRTGTLQAFTPLRRRP
ncbi:MAG TPA: SBBP repeat-containing protein [Acidobacteriota bacterium]|jgi:hypothetical protein